MNCVRSSLILCPELWSGRTFAFRYVCSTATTKSPWLFGIERNFKTGLNIILRQKFSRCFVIHAVNPIWPDLVLFPKRIIFCHPPQRGIAFTRALGFQFRGTKRPGLWLSVTEVVPSCSVLHLAFRKNRNCRLKWRKFCPVIEERCWSLHFPGLRWCHQHLHRREAGKHQRKRVVDKPAKEIGIGRCLTNGKRNCVPRG